MEEGQKPPPVRIEIAWKTIVKVLAGVLLAVVAVKLWPLCKLLIVSILVAVPLYRIVVWACKKGWPRWVGPLLATLTLLLGMLGIVALLGPVAVSQATNLGKNLPKLKQQLVQHVPPGVLRNAIERKATFGSPEDFQRLVEPALSAAKTTLGAVLDVIVALALVIYLMIDGSRALQWLIAYFPKGHRRRVAKGLEKIGDRVVSYIVGQSIVSGLFAGSTLVVLSLLHVPMAVLLAVLAGVLDVLPVIGMSIVLVLGALMGLTVSPLTALLVVVFYACYHVLENYFILPKVYGKKLRLSTLTVLVSMIAGGMVAGVIGAIAILPVVAAYPALEGLWLARELEPKVVEDHQEQLRAA